MNTYKRIHFKELTVALALCTAAPIASAGPSADWSDSWNFPSPAQRTNQLIQADLIEKKENGYYDGLGSTTNHINYSVSNAYGVYNETEYNLTNSGDGKIIATTEAKNFGDTSARISYEENSIHELSGTVNQ